MTDKEPRDSVTPLTTSMNVTQVAVEEWTPTIRPQMRLTQIAVEEWASVGGVGFFSARHI